MLIRPAMMALHILLCLATVVGAHGRLAEREVALATSIAYTRVGLRC
jgi:hypothetical protein